MIKYKYNHILKKKRKDIIILKHQLKTAIIKSIIQNRNIPFLNKSYLNIYLFLSSYKNIKKVCFLNGQFKSINKNLKLSRFEINYLAKSNNLVK